MKVKFKKSIKPTMISFSIFLAAYLFLCTQSKNAYFGLPATFFYLFSYIISFWLISVFPTSKYLSPTLAFLNAVLLILMQFDRKSESSFIPFGWDWLLGLSVALVGATNFILSALIVLILILDDFKKRKKHKTTE